MDKKLYAPSSIQSLVSTKAYQALEDGKGSRVIGSNNGISVNDEFTLLKIDYTEQLFPPTGMSMEEFREFSEEEQKAQGRLNGWFYFETNNGNLSFSAVMGDKEMYAEDFWKDVATKSSDFNVDNIFRPTARTASAWVKNGCDNLLGKTLKCVAVKEYQRGNFDAKARAFVVKA